MKQQQTLKNQITNKVKEYNDLNKQKLEIEKTLNKELPLVKDIFKKPIEQFDTLISGLNSVRSLMIRKKQLVFKYDYGSIHNDTIIGFGFTNDEKYAFSVGADKKFIHLNLIIISFEFIVSILNGKPKPFW